MHTQLAPLWKWDIIWRQADRASRPIVILPWLIQCFLNALLHCEGEGEKRCCADHPSGLETNESVFFLRLRPRWDDPSSRARNRLPCHFVIEKLHWDDKKASATSITCTALPAIVRSLKAIHKWFWKGNISLPQWSKVLSRWCLPLLWFMAKDCPHFIALFPPLFSFLPHLPPSIHPSIYVSFVRQCCREFSRVFNCLLFATWHRMKGGTNNGGLRRFIYLY